MSDNIKVVVKVRPLISREIEDKLSYQWRVRNDTLNQLDQQGREFGSSFTFDKVYDKDTKTREVYNDVAKPIVEAAIAGFNGTIFAYGQTSSGKTYTMTGTESSPGIIPLAVLNLFETIKNVPDRDFLVRVSYIEIYNETLRDLLDVNKKNIKIHDTYQGGVKVDVMEKVTSSPEEVLDAMKEGEANRQTGATNMNEESSRSHSIFQITIESREHIEGEEEVGCVNVSQLNLVDLAGSERAGQTGATGIRFKEGTHINKSLSVLALVIKQLSEDPNKFANYRDSKLTRILQNSLGGNAKTSIICAITPASVEETISTLQFANRAKAIKNKPEVNAVATNATMIQSLTKQLSKLQSQLESKKTVEQNNVNLQKQIAALQKLILNGFGQRSSIDMMGTNRRKQQPPRRITISTLHPIEEDPIPTVPRFCTPSLKYNPMSIPTDFLPIQNVIKPSLTSLPEEARMVTPPPRDKKVNFNDEIIELDSDDEDSEVHTCSPYHKCHGSSKTPPCILRKNAKQAEKSLKEIVELTEREKIYAPNVVELIEKLEQNTNVIAKLEDEINALRENSKEKDSELEQLRSKISKTEDQIKIITNAKEDLEILCNNYNTKITDWEVSYETLKKKAKSREEDLVSILEENKILKKTEEIGKLSRTVEREMTNFMDISKEISLVNSDTESSITNANDEESTAHIQELVTELQTQLTNKNQAVLELESNISTQKQEIDTLECFSQELQSMVASFKERITEMETENSYLKSTVETLTTTINKQKVSLETANNDIKSYNTVIDDLQVKISKKDDLLNIKISEGALETMIANEERFLANNDNMKNIIHSFKITLDSRNKEIESLKSTIQTDSELFANNVSLKEQVESKERQISILIDEVEMLKGQLNENLEMINKLMSLEKELCSKVREFEEQNSELQKNVDEKSSDIESLKERNNKLTDFVSEKDAREQELTDTNLILTKQIEDMTHKIFDLETDISTKDHLISSLNNLDNDMEKHVSKANSAILKLYNILITFKCETQGIPRVIDDLELFFDILDDNLNILESQTLTISEENKEIVEKTKELKEQMSSLLEKYETETEKLQTQIENLSKERNEVLNQYEDLSNQIIELTKELDNVRQQQDEKHLANIDLESKLNEARESNENLRNVLLSKDDMVLSLEEKISSLSMEVESISQNKEQNHSDLKQTIENLYANQESLEQMLKDKDVENSQLQNVLKEQNTQVSTLNQKLNESRENTNNLLNNILHKVSKVTVDCSIENSISCEIENSDNICEKILLTIDTIANYIITKSEKVKFDSNNLLSEAKEQNLELMEAIAEIDFKNQELFSEMKALKKINEELSGTNQLLEQLKIELKEKATDLDMMEVKATELKDKFKEFECVVKEQVEELEAENELLKERVAESQSKANKQANVGNKIRKSISCLVENVERKSPQSLLTICCNKIIEAMEPDDNDFISVTTSSSKGNVESQIKVKENICECAKLKSQLQTVHEENLNLKDDIRCLESFNGYLIEEQEEVRKEIQLLIEPANELQKKIINHRTNLSTLTATTYAENKLLNSQLKVLKHHHTRYIHVCQRDIPAFKSQLHDLMTMLKGTPSMIDKQNASFKRYSLPDVLDSNATVCNFKNESTLDGDFLMLDTNVTLASADNTLLGNDQTCLDVTQINFDSEVACQTNDLSNILDPCLVYSRMEVLTNDNQHLYEKLQALQEENVILREQITKFSPIESCVQKVDAHNSPIKINGGSLNTSLSNTLTEDESLCKDSKQEDEFVKDNLLEEIRLLSQELTDVKAQKEELMKKYSDLALEIPSTDALVKKLCILEKEYNSKTQELVKLANDLKGKNKIIKELQEENDTLSSQVMENISEADDLRKELDMLKEVTNELKQLDHLETVNELKTITESHCSQCKAKDEFINTLQSKQTSETHAKLNRSLSDTDSSSRITKIYTLQNELHASKEDCKKITEEVATIKNHLDRSNLSMDLDGSIGDSNMFTFTKEYDAAEAGLNKFNMPNIPEERPSDMYTMDKIDCFTYFVERTGANKDNLNSDVKIIDVMKLLYDTLVTKHGNEVENLVNKMRDFEDSNIQLRTQILKVTSEYSKVTKDLELKNNNIETITNVLSQMRRDIKSITDEIPCVFDSEKNTKFVTAFKKNVLSVLDTEFDLSTAIIFESLIESTVSKHEKDLNEIMKQYTELQQRMETVVSEFKSVNDNLTQMKSQLLEKENEYCLLKAQKERVYEISSAVTKDIVELNETIMKGCDRLLEHNIICPGDMNLTETLSKNVNILFERLINIFNDNKNKSDLEKEKESLMTELCNCKKVLVDKEQLLETLNEQLLDTENKLKTQLAVQSDMSKLYENKIKENKSNLDVIENLTREIQALQKTVLEKETTVKTLETAINTQKKEVAFENQATHADLTQRIQDLVHENGQLKSVNEIITKEKESYSIELEKVGETLKKNKIELDRMTGDILVLRETISDNVSIIESLSLEAKSLLQQNEQMKKRFEEKCQNCFRLENNIKTHEKTAEIQSKMIMRLQKQKEQDDQAMGDKNKQIEDLTQRCLVLRKECDEFNVYIKNSKEELDGLKTVKQSLEARISELEMEVEHGNKNRMSIDAIADNARRRRQSLHDAQRVLTDDFEDHNKMEAVFGSRGKPDDLFMETDDDSSNRSSPNRLSRGRDSFYSRPDQSDKEEELSRPSSVLATRRRRQSIHDLHRSVVRHTPSPHDSLKLIDEIKNMKSDTSGGIPNESEISQLRHSLTSCQQELEELKEKYRELDDECETCAQYLRERDDQCVRLKKEKTALEKQVEELNDKLKTNMNGSETASKPSLKHASVNTDEDWANLHSVVVDRMSFDVEVEKNKKLTKTIEDLRYKKQELKNTLTKMQKAIEKHDSYKDHRELEVTKSELKACKQELEELKQQYKELDEECETCAEYLRERDEQCQKLKQAKAMLEAKLQELQEDSGSVLQSVRKKRQSLHDQNRAPSADLQDATTETTEDFLSHQMELDESSRAGGAGNNALARELKQVRSALDRVSKEKLILEQMMATVQPTMFVATGSAIVQNQQLTDVMKENHKLKKINAKLITICKKRGKSHETNRENEKPNEMG